MTSPDEEEKYNKLKSHVEQINKVFHSVIPKMPSSW